MKPATAVERVVFAGGLLLVVAAFVALPHRSSPANPSAGEPQVAATSSPAPLVTVGELPPELDAGIVWPIGADDSLRVGLGQPSAGITVLGFFSTAPVCECKDMWHTLGALNKWSTVTDAQILEVGVKAQWGTAGPGVHVIAVDASTLGTPTSEKQYALDRDIKLPVTSGILHGVSWVDDHIPAIVVIDHDMRIRYVATGAQVADVAALENALDESVAHYRREHHQTPVQLPQVPQ